MRLVFHTDSNKPVAIGDTVEFSYAISRGYVTVRMTVARLDPFECIILEEDLEKTLDPIGNRGHQSSWNFSQYIGLTRRTLVNGEIIGENVFFNESLIPIADTVIDYTGTLIPLTAAVKLTIENETKYALMSTTIEIDGEIHLKRDCFRIITTHAERHALRWQSTRADAGTWVAEEPEDGFVYMDDFEVWADEELVNYCFGNDQYYWYDQGDEWHDEWYSDDWLNDNTFVCDCCGERFANDDYAEDGNCTSCWSPPSGLQSYSDKSSAKFRPEKNVPLKFGIELEVESRDANQGVELCESIFPDQYVVYKEDGSLSCEGFEIVTRPDAPEVHKRIFDKFLSDTRVRRTLTSWNSGSCGVHIHVSRAPLSALWIGRILVMINSPAMRSIVSKVAGRYDTGYASIRHKTLVHGRKGKDERKYDAVNNSPRDTIEFRLFRGTLVKESFLRYIEFVESVLAFTSPATTSNRDVSEPQKYLDFVSKRRKDYKNLFEFLKRKDFPVSGPVHKPRPADK